MHNKHSPLEEYLNYADRDRTADLAKIGTPSLVIATQYDTMDPEHLEWMAGEMQNGRYLHCPSGSHMCLFS